MRLMTMLLCAARQVEDLDGEAAKLREALATAKLKRDHIDKLLEQYQKRTVASATKET